MSTLKTHSSTLVITQCWCGLWQAIPDSLYDEAVKRKKAVYCPLGHTWVFLGKTPEEKERERRIQAEAALAQEEDRHGVTKRRLSATKGLVTKTKRRIASGVCPCCQRTFANVAAHMETQHPDYVKDPV